MYKLAQILLLATIPSFTLAWTIPILGLGAAPPPSAILTTDISPQCANVNNGTYLCCSSAVQGGDPIVVSLATAAGYQLPANTVNGVECKQSLRPLPFRRCFMTKWGVCADRILNV